MGANEHGDLEGSALQGGAAMTVPQVATGVEADAEGGRSDELHAGITEVAHAGVGVAGEDHAAGDVLAGVDFKVDGNGVAAQVDLVAGEDLFLHRRFAGGNRGDAALGETDPAFDQVALVQIEKQGYAAAAGEEIGEDRHGGAGDIVKKQRRIAALALQL